uniref:Uncharacterized protein n=1 Tax=Rhizophora mucronata TaxID=61149 RepID=A0A2P2NBV9_RHIMU
MGFVHTSMRLEKRLGQKDELNLSCMGRFC